MDGRPQQQTAGAGSQAGVEEKDQRSLDLLNTMAPEMWSISSISPWRWQRQTNGVSEHIVAPEGVSHRGNPGLWKEPHLADCI